MLVCRVNRSKGPGEHTRARRVWRERVQYVAEVLQSDESAALGADLPEHLQLAHTVEIPKE